MQPCVQGLLSDGASCTINARERRGVAPPGPRAAPVGTLLLLRGALPVPAGRTAPRAANRRGGKMRCGCRPWCCGEMRWRCRVWRSSEMWHCGRMRLWPEGWMDRHHQMPRGRRRPGDVRLNSGTRRSRPNQMAYRCRSLFRLQPRHLMRRDRRHRPREVWLKAR